MSEEDIVEEKRTVLIIYNSQSEQFFILQQKQSEQKDELLELFNRSERLIFQKHDNCINGVTREYFFVTSDEKVGTEPVAMLDQILFKAKNRQLQQLEVAVRSAMKLVQEQTAVA